MPNLKLFAGLREAAGAHEAEIEADTLGGLLEKAGQIFGPAFSAQASRAKVALNGIEIPQAALSDTSIGPDDEVALLPPVSGGSEAAAPTGYPAGAGLAWSAGVAAAAVLASSVSAALLAVYVALLAGLAVLTLSKATPKNSPAAGAVAAALASAGFPLCLLLKGEDGLMWAAGFAVLLVGASLLLVRPAGGAVVPAGWFIWLPIYVGFGLSYAVLLTQQGGGPKQLLSVALILLAYKGSAVVVSAVVFGRSSLRNLALSPLSMRLAGVGAAEVAAMGSVAFLGEPYSAGPLAILALVVALAAMLGETFGRSIAAELCRAGLKPSAWTGLDAWLLALPAFFYAFRLYLT